MNQALLNPDQWEQVGELFDQLADLPPQLRELDTLDQPPPVRQLLERMLRAHDSCDAQLLDRTVGSIAAGMLPVVDPIEADYRGRRFGPWRAISEVGRGGMAVVLKGERADDRFEKEVAIKLLPAGGYAPARERLLEEIRILARLEHPGIARLIDGGVDSSGTPYLVMEFVEGVPITEHCRRQSLDLRERIELFGQVVEAVQYAHQRLVVHCDIKPGNVLVTARGEVRLVDFGIAGLVSVGRSDTAPERGWFCSPAYAAPEQLRGEPPAIEQDVFSLGAVLYELLSDHSIRDNRIATRMLMSAHPPANAPTAPSLLHDRGSRDLDAICLKALATEPQARYATAESLLQDLERWRRHQPVLACAGGFRYRFGKWLRRHRLPAAAGALAMVALVTGSGLALWQAGRAQLEAEQARVETIRATTVKDFLLSLFRAGDPLRAGGAVLDTREVLAVGAERVRADDTLPLDVRIEILNTLADVQRTLDWDEDALELLEEALRLAASVQNPPAMAYAETLYQLGTFHANVRGELDEALDWYGRALSVIPATAGRQHEWMQARTLIARGGVLARLGRLDAADDDLERADHLLAGLDPPDLEQEMILASSRGVGAYSAGRYEQAYAYLSRTAELQRELGNEHTGSMVMTLANLGAVASVLGRLDEAQSYDREAVAVARQAYPPGHHQIGWALYALGDTLRQMGRFSESEQYLLEARELFTVGEQDVRVESVDLVLARLSLARGDATAALALAQRLRPALEQRYGNTSTEVLRLLEVEIAAAARDGSGHALREAEALAAARIEQVTENHRYSPVTQQLRWRLAASALARGDGVAASEWLEQALQAPADAPVNASVSLLLNGLAVRLAADTQPKGVDPALIERLAALAENSPEASVDARLYAWLTIAGAAQVDKAATGQALAAARDLAGHYRPSAEFGDELDRYLAQP